MSSTGTVHVDRRRLEAAGHDVPEGNLKTPTSARRCRRCAVAAGRIAATGYPDCPSGELPRTYPRQPSGY